MKTGLLLVDIQNDYFPGGPMALAGMEEASSKARDLLLLFREKKWPTFHIQHLSTVKGATVFAPDTHGAEIHESIKPLPQEGMIQKHYANSFRETRLLDELKNAGVERLVICGAMSHMCVEATTRAAADLGFMCIVIHDGCATMNLEFAGKKIPAEQVHGSSMAALGFGYAKTMGFDEFKSGIENSDAE